MNANVPEQGNKTFNFAQTEGKHCDSLWSRLKHTSYIIHSLEVVVTMTTEMCAPT